jgi:glucose-6-phosphate isomerase
VPSSPPGRELTGVDPHRAPVRALAFGKTEEQVVNELGPEQSKNQALVKSKIFAGNKPTNSILFQKLTPKTLGSLIAMYGGCFFRVPTRRRSVGMSFH